MRQLNIAQRCVNVVALVRDCAFVAVANVVLLPRHLHTHLSGTSSKSTAGTSSKSNGYERPEISSWQSGFYGMFRMQQMQPATQPITRTSTRERSQ
jgi:tRNA G18 (ribose-2'-O)-methylase SpoU